MSLGYYTPTITGSGTVPAARYSGDISSWTWTHGNGNAAVTRSYGFTYDGDHRLTDARYYTGTTATSVTNNLSERGITYDRAGNITSLTRYDNSGTGTTLSYSYTGNRRSNYGYDVNGDVTSDATNNLQSSYNLINLPAQIKSGDTVKAKYTYLSDGTKVAAYTSANAGRDYAGSFTYTRGSGGAKTLESVAFSGGRIRRTGTNTYDVDYYITDHLGSVRAIVNAGGSVVEQNDYYPFGTRHSISGQPTLSANRWRFSGKEEQDAFGIPYSDFGARLYDRTAWTAIDPMAEKYYDISPYLYCAGNPLVFGDPTGEDYYYLHKDGTITLAYIDDLDKDNDYLWSLSETEAFGQYLSFRVSDKTILKSLSQVSLKDNYSHSVLSDSSEIIDLFDFIVHNSSKREWAMGLFQTKEGNKYALIQGKKSSGVLAVEYLDSIDPLDLRVKIHTHVGEIQDHGASGYVQGPTIVPNDHSNYNTLKKLFDSHKKNMPRHYVYEVPYGFIYEYNANNGAKPYGKYSLSRLRNLMR